MLRRTPDDQDPGVASAGQEVPYARVPGLVVIGCPGGAGHRAEVISVHSRTWSAGDSQLDQPKDRHLLIIYEAGAIARLEIRRTGGATMLTDLHQVVTIVGPGSRITTRVLEGHGSSHLVAFTDPGFDAGPRSGWRDHGRDMDVRNARLRETVAWFTRGDANAPSQDDLLHRHLARLTAAAIGLLAHRPDDSWLPPAALARVADLAGTVHLDDHGVRTLADAAGLSVSAFSRAFRGSTGTTPGRHLLDTRMRLVDKLLGGTDLPLAEVAERAGLSSVSHLVQRVRARHGTTPERYRKAATERHKSSPAARDEPA